jgi:dihydrolipoamide dehydrogenase
MAPTDATTETDVLVIGGGPGGYVAAIRAAQHDLDVTLVEADAYGGTCLNDGCIPSKAFITAADVAHDAANAAGMGIHADPTVDMAELAAWKDGVVDRLTSGVEKLCKANGVGLIEGTATFADDHTARVAHGDTEQDPEFVAFEACVVATGSRPVEIPGFSFADEHVWSSSDALAAETVPDELVVIGAGYIGMELSTMFAKVGADVTVVEMLDSALPAYDDDIARIVRSRAADLGVEFRFGEGASEWREAEAGIEVATETADGERAVYDADRVLVAVGRRPVTDTLGLDAIGLDPDDNGFLTTDDRTRTDLDHVYAVGDVAGEPMLAHKASAEGIVAAETIAGMSTTLDSQAIPAAVFTDPEIGTVGLTESEAVEAGYDPIVGEMPMRASGRALTMNESEGFVRLVGDGDTGSLLGGQVVAPEASELIAEIGVAIELGATVDDVAETIHTHPTLSEATMEAAENAMEQAIHTLNR